MSGLLNGNYTSDYYSWLPCYVGWLSARILSDGSVIPCCGCWEKPLGNIRRNSFPEIWRSEEYQTFRNKSIEIFKHPEMVSGCKCSSCNDFAFNLNIYKKIHPFKQNG